MRQYFSNYNDRGCAGIMSFKLPRDGTVPSAELDDSTGREFSPGPICFMGLGLSHADS